jgi:23S rRNA pseudouridine2605 synthase
MFEKIGHPVEKLSRETYGFLTLKGLQPGDYRPLKPHEVEELKEMTAKTNY